MTNVLSSTTLAEVEQMNTLVDTMAAKLSENGLREEIDELSDFVVVVAQSFGNVIVTFGNTIAGSGTSWDLKLKLGQALAKWIEHCVQFGKLVLLSINVAADALDTADDFLGNILPMLLDDNISKQAKKDRVASFMSTLDAKAHNARDMSQGFVDLQKAIDQFVKEFKDMLASYNLSDMEKRIKQLDTEIKSLTDTLDSLRKQVAELSKQLEAAQAAASVTGIFGFFCPAFWIGTAIASAKASSLKSQLESVRNQRNNTVRDIGTKERERSGLQADIQAIPLLRAATEKSTPDVKEIITRIGSCANVWAAIRADTQGIMEKLEYAQDTESIALFKARVRTAAGMYTILRDALVIYKEYLDKSRELKEALEKYGLL